MVGGFFLPAPALHWIPLGCAMTFSIYTHDSWGQIHVGDFGSLKEAREVFGAMRQDTWYGLDGTVKGIELVQTTAPGERQRLEWFGF